MPYPDCMLPLAPNYTMIEAAVVEAAWAGCDTIWIVCNDDVSPLVRYRIGDFIQDPIYFFNNFGKQPERRMRRIPIFWVPVHPKDRDKRDCLSWSVIYGALSSLKVSSSLSKWMIPDKYYVSFPYGIFDPKILQKQRTLIRSGKNFFISHNKKTVQDNMYCSFTFGKEEFIRYRRNIRKGTGRYTSKLNENGYPSEYLPIEERWSARFFELDEVFTDNDFGSSNLCEITEFYNLNNWNLYKKYIFSEFSSTMERPPKGMFSYKEFNSIAKNK
jgi:hypothetical protein